MENFDEWMFIDGKILPLFVNIFAVKILCYTVYWEITRYKFSMMAHFEVFTFEDGHLFTIDRNRIRAFFM